jgi:hypothetical protein
MIASLTTLTRYEDTEGQDTLSKKIDTGNFGTETLQQTRSRSNLKQAVTLLDSVSGWAANRATLIELRPQQEDCLKRWEQVISPVFSIEPEDTNFRHLSSNFSDDNIPIDQVRTEIDAVERIAVLAEAVRSVIQKNNDKIPDGFRKDFATPIKSTEIENMSERVEQLFDALTTIRKVMRASEEYPSVSFKPVITHLLSRLKSGEINNNFDPTDKLINDATRVLSFLEKIDDSLVDIDSEEWREEVQSGLENHSRDLIRPWIREIERRDDSRWDRSHLANMDWRQFEKLVARVYEGRGYRTEVTRAKNDEGVDVWAENEGNNIAIQVKRLNSQNVGRPVLQKTVSSIAKGDTDKASVVSSTGFTSSAKTYANDFGKDLSLIDGDKLVRWLNESDLPPPSSEVKSDPTSKLLDNI